MAKRVNRVLEEGKSLFEDDRQTQSFQQPHDPFCPTEYDRDGHVQMGFRRLDSAIY